MVHHLTIDNSATLTVGGSFVAASLTVGSNGGGTLHLDGNSSLKLDAWSGDSQTLTGLTLAEGATLEFGEDVTTGTLNLGALTLDGNANLALDGVLADLKLAATNLPLDGTHKLAIKLSETFLETILGSMSGEYQLFSDSSWSSVFVDFTPVVGYEIGWGSDGKITVSVAKGIRWEASEGGNTFTWSATEQTDPWTVGGN